MKLKQLESELSKIDYIFKQPKIEFEQYPTTPHLASLCVFSAFNFGDIENRSVLDLGIGCGILSCASILMGSSYNVGIDIDTEVFTQANENCSNYGPIDLINANISSMAEQPLKLIFDTVIMNPPFGTKAKGIDVDFLKAASKIATNAIYTFHKTSTREFILNKGLQFGLKGKVLAELKYTLPASYKFHKKKSIDIEVDFIRFEFLNNKS
jgi:predicted RNA methylase